MEVGDIFCKRLRSDHIKMIRHSIYAKVKGTYKIYFEEGKYIFPSLLYSHSVNEFRLNIIERY